MELDLAVKDYFKGKLSRPSELERKTKETLKIKENVSKSGYIVETLPSSV